MGKTAGGAGIHLGSLLYAHILRRGSRSATHEADDDADASSCCCCCSIGTAGSEISCFFFWANLEQFSMRPSLWRFLKSKGGSWGPLGDFARCLFCRRVEDL